MENVVIKIKKEYIIIIIIVLKLITIKSDFFKI